MKREHEGENCVDGNVFNKTPTGLHPNVTDEALQESRETSPERSPDVTGNIYNMSGKKLMVVFNFKTFQPTIHYHYEAPSERAGTEHDILKITEVFKKKLGFELIVHNNLNYTSFWEENSKLIKRDFSDYSCISIVISTHGGNNGELYAVDRPFNLRDLLFMYKTILVGKPKLFFIQACRGDSRDSGVLVADGDSFPNEHTEIALGDFFVMKSTVEDYVSFRSPSGSWLLQELCKAVDAYHEEEDLFRIATRVNLGVYQRISSSYNPCNNNLKQTSQFMSSLTRLVKF